jgi:hypothetical protein
MYIMKFEFFSSYSRIHFKTRAADYQSAKKLKTSLDGRVSSGRTVSGDIFCAKITVGKSQRLWGSLNTNFDARGCLLLLNHNR